MPLPDIARREWRGSSITVVVMAIPMGTTIITPHLYAWWSLWAFQFPSRAHGGKIPASVLGQKKDRKCKLLGPWMVPQSWDLTRVVQGLKRSSWMNATVQWMPLVFIDIIWCQKLLTCHLAWRVLCLAIFPTSEPRKKEPLAASPNLRAWSRLGSLAECWPETDALSTLCSRTSWVACHMGWRARARARGLWPTSSEGLVIMELALQEPLVAAVAVAVAQPAAVAVAPLRKQPVDVDVAQPAAVAVAPLRKQPVDVDVAVAQPAAVAVAPLRKQPVDVDVAQPAAVAVAPLRKQPVDVDVAVAQPAAVAVAPLRKQPVDVDVAVAQPAAVAVAPLRKQAVAVAVAVAQPAAAADVVAAAADAVPMRARGRCSAPWGSPRRRALAQWSACRSAIWQAGRSPSMQSRSVFSCTVNGGVRSEVNLCGDVTACQIFKVKLKSKSCRVSFSELFLSGWPVQSHFVTQLSTTIWRYKMVFPRIPISFLCCSLSGPYMGNVLLWQWFWRRGWHIQTTVRPTQTPDDAGPHRLQTEVWERQHPGCHHNYGQNRKRELGVLPKTCLQVDTCTASHPVACIYGTSPERKTHHRVIPVLNCFEPDVPS